MNHMQLDHHEVMSKKHKLTYTKEIILFLDQISLPSNIAGIFRLADAFSVSQILIRGNSDVIHSKKFRAIARTHEENLNYKHIEDSEVIPFIHFLKNQGFTITGLEFTLSSTLLPNHVFTDKTILVLGSESHGISEELLSICQSTVHIPMEGNISSLNVTTATGMALYEIRRSDLI